MSQPRFDAILAESLGNWGATGREPSRLRESVAALRERVGRMGALSDQPRLFARAIGRLLQGPDKLRTSDDLVLASRLSSASLELEGCSILDRADLLMTLLARWRARMSKPFLSPLLWHSAFLAYFFVEEEVPRLELRQFLLDTLGELEVGPLSAGWVSVAHKHRNVLQEDSVADYASEWLVGGSEALDEISVHARIPPTSWFWRALTAGVVAAACRLDDSNFAGLIPRLLGLVGRFPNFGDDIIAHTLSRYADSASPARRSDLLELAVERWGSPQVDLAGRSHRWSQASEGARKLVCQWLAEDDLTDFFEIIRTSTRSLDELDQRRLAYWMRFTGRMEFTRLVLGAAYRNSSNGDVRRFIQKRKDRLSWLTDGGADNLAILMKIGDWWFVEFGQSGNACYGYSESGRPFDTSMRNLSIRHLKIRSRAKYWLVHRGDWESDFDRELARVGIWPNSVISSSRYREAAPVRPMQVVIAGWPDDLDTELQGELKAMSMGTVDNRSKGGSFWIETEGTPSQKLRVAMGSRGFRFAKSRGFYR